MRLIRLSTEDLHRLSAIRSMLIQELGIWHKSYIGHTDYEIFADIHLMVAGGVVEHYEINRNERAR